MVAHLKMYGSLKKISVT